jgi:hypothetical protein
VIAMRIIGGYKWRNALNQVWPSSTERLHARRRRWLRDVALPPER